MSRKLGQHFLKDKNILAAIARETLLITHYPLPTVIEIGPGHGELTDQLLATSGARLEKLIGIEKDPPLAIQLRKKYRNDPCVEIVEGDVRTILPSFVMSYKSSVISYSIVGNIPYYLTGYLFRLLGELITNDVKLITRIVLLIQKEVAERVTATAPRANLLGSMVQGWAAPRIAFAVPRGAFSPPPKVDSALLVLEPIPRDQLAELPNYFKATKLLFAHPRKTLANNLMKEFKLTRVRTQELVSSVKLPKEARAAALTPAHIRALAKMVYHKYNDA